MEIDNDSVINFFKVVTENHPCKTCKTGETFTIVFIENGEEVGLGEIFSDKDQAEEHCDELNYAYNHGEIQRLRLVQHLKALIGLCKDDDQDQSPEAWIAILDAAEKAIKEI